MTKIVCDRCGQQVVSHRHTDMGYYVISISINPKFQSNRTGIDLCDNCSGLLNKIVREFIKGTTSVTIEPLIHEEPKSGWVQAEEYKIVLPKVEE